MSTDTVTQPQGRSPYSSPPPPRSMKSWLFVRADGKDGLKRPALAKGETRHATPATPPEERNRLSREHKSLLIHDGRMMVRKDIVMTLRTAYGLHAQYVQYDDIVEDVTGPLLAASVTALSDLVPAAEIVLDAAIEMVAACVRAEEKRAGSVDPDVTAALNAALQRRDGKISHDEAVRILNRCGESGTFYGTSAPARHCGKAVSHLLGSVRYMAWEDEEIPALDYDEQGRNSISFAAQMLSWAFDSAIDYVMATEDNNSSEVSAWYAELMRVNADLSNRLLAAANIEA